MSNGFADGSNGNWLHSSLSDSDAINQNNLSMCDLNQTPATNNNQTNFTRIHYRRFMCGACGEKVLEQELMAHHSENHFEMPFIMDMYEIFEIDELVQCLVCNAEMSEEDFKEHSHTCHSGVEIGAAKSNQELQIGDSTIGIYNCKMCHARGLKEPNLERHHLRAHSYIPANTNIFDFTHLITITKKIKCDVCGKQYNEKSLQKHRLKYHPDKCESSQGFRQIYISDNEFKLLQSLNRFYETDGRIYLKDSD